MKEEILKTYRESKWAWKTRNIAKNKEWINFINEKYPNSKMSLADKLRLLNDGVETLPTCIICDNVLNRYGMRTCSVECRGKRITEISDERADKYRKTCMERYGEDNPQKVSYISNKRIKTMEKKRNAKKIS